MPEDLYGAWCWPQSVLPGESLNLHASTPGPVHVRVTRQGGDDREVLALQCNPGPQALPEDAAESGCDWPAAISINTEHSWPSGFYRVDLEPEHGQVLHAFFVLRANKPGDLLFVLSTSTWAAYNHWGGPSFYTGGHHSSLQRPLPPGFLSKPDPTVWRLARFYELSREARRGFAADHSAWSMCAGWANQELLFARWAETRGIQLDYATSEDLHQQGDALLNGYRAYVSVGHDEYWSAEMRDAVEAWVDAGGNAAFFSGNTSFWQIRYDSSNRIIAHKMALESDPVYGTGDAHRLSTMWSDPIVGRPENQMTGVSFTRGGYAHMMNAPRGSGGYTVWQPNHWAFDGIDLMTGDILGAEPVVVGYECDGCELQLANGVPVPTGADGTPLNFQVLGTAPAHLWETAEGLAAGTSADVYVGELNWVAERIGGADTPENRARFTNGRAVMGTFERGTGNVFTAGCTDWAYGLADPTVGRVTENVLSRFTQPRG